MKLLNLNGTGEKQTYQYQCTNTKTNNRLDDDQISLLSDLLWKDCFIKIFFFSNYMRKSWHLFTIWINGIWNIICEERKWSLPIKKADEFEKKLLKTSKKFGWVSIEFHMAIIKKKNSFESGNWNKGFLFVQLFDCCLNTSIHKWIYSYNNFSLHQIKQENIFVINAISYRRLYKKSLKFRKKYMRKIFISNLNSVNEDHGNNNSNNNANGTSETVLSIRKQKFSDATVFHRR